MSEKKMLPKPPLFTSDYILMAEILDFALDRFGQLILALMYYTADGTVPEDLPTDLKAMFAIYQKKIDAAREKYERTCTVRAENGSKGGKAKAENAQKKGQGAKFKPPTHQQFMVAFEHLGDDGAISPNASTYNADAFFDELREAGWTINGEPIQKRQDWENALSAKFYGFGAPDPKRLYYQVFSTIFADFHGFRDSSGKSWADDASSEFMDTYDQATKLWVVRGESFQLGAWKDALARFMENCSNPGND